MQLTRRRFGLLSKLAMTILVVGTIPLVVSLSVTYYRSSSELQDVIGASFQALAEDSAAKVDAEIQRIITVDRILAQQASLDSAVRTELQGKGLSVVQFDWPPITAPGPVTGILLASWVTGQDTSLEGVKARSGSTEEATTRVSGLHFDSLSQQYLFRISTPIQEGQDTPPIGWLHRDYDIKKVFDPLVYPIRFGDTGHVMLIDNLGAIVSCPLLVTGSRIEDQTLLTRVAIDKAGWITAENDGHGGQTFSIVSHAPLGKVNSLLQPGESWHMFVWQDSHEIFAPTRSLLIGVTLAGLLSIGLLVALGYYASRNIVKPIRRLRQEASHIAAGDLSHPLVVHTGDEIEELAGEFNKMRIQLRQHIGTLEDKVEERTRELIESQSEKERVMEQLIQTEKVAAIGTMASGIGHEINNPLYVILGRAEAIENETDISACQNYGQDIIKHANHIAEIVKNLSGYIHPASQHELEKVDVNEQLAEALAMAERSLLDDRIKIHQNFGQIPKISAKNEDIQQVFFNVIRNGIQAITGKGLLEVTTTFEEGLIRICIRDTGVGIPTELLGKIFDPFFTTKGPDTGEGLGMYIVQQIVKKYDGTISLESQEGKGTTVTIHFPCGEPIRKED
jgi:signal transduction histidine kinase